MASAPTRRRFLLTSAVVAAGLLLVGCASVAVRPEAAGPESALAWKAGVARVCITPEKPVWMTGYGSRSKPSEGTMLNLYARALALEAADGGRAVLVTTDVIGYPASVAQAVADRCREKYGLPRERLMLTVSHTHGGPALRNLLKIISSPKMTPEHERAVDDYTRVFVSKIVAAVGQALADLQPARLSFGCGEATFGMNRRQKTADKGVILGVNPEGPVDHTVPVLRIDSPEGRLRAVAFLYACHNTTMGGNIYEFHGDYAGFAEAALEACHPGAAAMFFIGCGADANPAPRGTPELAREHGLALAAAVEKALAGPLTPAGGSLRVAWGEAALPFAPPPAREALEDKAKTSKNVHEVAHARALVAALDRDGRLPASYTAPVQAWRFGNEVTLVALPGEVVVDYALRLKKELGGGAVWVAGYSNDVFAYVPTRRILEEGGYEPVISMMYYGHPGPFAPEVEETLIRKVHEVVGRVQGK